MDTETVTIFAESIEDVASIGVDSLEVTLAGVDIKKLIADMSPADILDVMDVQDIKDYLETNE